MGKEEEGGAVPQASKGSWSSFLKSMASFNGDLSSLTAPAFIVSSQSLTEFSAYWTEHPSIWIAPSKEPDPAKRALLVLKWFLTSLKQSYCSRSEKLGSEKKPLNPFLGELHLGEWHDEMGTTQLVSEQVSHHPPVTAYCIWNDQHSVRLQGYNAQKASFSRTIHVKQVGHALLSFTPPNSKEVETYLITLPSIHIENLIYGSPFVELNKYTHIVSSSGYVAKVDYSGKGWLSGKKNSFTASLWRHGSGGGDEKHPLFSVDGQWNEKFEIKEGDGKHAKVIDSYDGNKAKTTPLTVAPIEQQDPFESRRAWQNVAKSVQKGDMDALSHHKTIIENAQRSLRAREQKEGREWKRRFFTRVENNREPHIDELVAIINKYGTWSLEADKTGGMWRFDLEKAKAAKPPFHPDSVDGLGLKSSDATMSPITPTDSNKERYASTMV